jgi:hypothetical protein
MKNNPKKNPDQEKPENPLPMSGDEFEARLKELKTMSDVSGFVKELVAPTLQRMLEAEMDNHLG